MERFDAEILFANDRFYAAFCGGDMTSMEALWSTAGPVSCLHPGRPPLLERAQIIASWNAILQTPPEIQCVAPKVLPISQEGAAVICWEKIEETYLIATNIYRLESGMWHMAHHQAVPVNGKPPSDPLFSNDVPPNGIWNIN